MNFENITEQIKEVAGVILGLMLITKWFQQESQVGDHKIEKLARERDNYLRVSEWG